MRSRMLQCPGLPHAPNTTSLFSGLTLGPGTYYLLTLSDPNTGGLAWQTYISPTLTSAPDVTLTAFVEVNTGSVAAYAPATSFTATNIFAFEFSVTGTAATAT